MVSDVVRVPGEAVRLLRIAAVCLFGVFLLTLFPLFLPPRLLDPLWQSQAINAVFASAPFPLLGTCLLLIGSPSASDSDQVPKLRRRLRPASRLASVGFVLLVVLQISCAWRLGLRAEIPTNRLIATLTSVRLEILSSRSVSELNTALAKLPGKPRLPPSFNLPIPEFQKATVARLEQDLRFQKEQQGRRIQARRLADSFYIARTSVLAALFSIFFAAVGGVPIVRPRLPSLKAIRPIQAIGSLLPRANPDRVYQKKLQQVARSRQSKHNGLGRFFKGLLQTIETGRRHPDGRGNKPKRRG